MKRTPRVFKTKSGKRYIIIKGKKYFIKSKLADNQLLKYIIKLVKIVTDKQNKKKRNPNRITRPKRTENKAGVDNNVAKKIDDQRKEQDQKLENQKKEQEKKLENQKKEQEKKLEKQKQEEQDNLQRLQDETNQRLDKIKQKNKDLKQNVRLLGAAPQRPQITQGNIKNNIKETNENIESLTILKEQLEQQGIPTTDEGVEKLSKIKNLVDKQLQNYEEKLDKLESQLEDKSNQLDEKNKEIEEKDKTNLESKKKYVKKNILGKKDNLIKIAKAAGINIRKDVGIGDKTIPQLNDELVKRGYEEIIEDFISETEKFDDRTALQNTKLLKSQIRKAKVAKEKIFQDVNKNTKNIRERGALSTPLKKEDEDPEIIQEEEILSTQLKGKNKTLQKILGKKKKDKPDEIIKKDEEEEIKKPSKEEEEKPSKEEQKKKLQDDLNNGLISGKEYNEAITQLGEGKNKNDNGMWDIEINKIMEPYKTKGYLGTYSIDELSKVAKLIKPNHKYGWIMNLDPSYKSGSHWIAVYLDPIDSKSLEYFDPLGDPEPERFSKDIVQVIDKIKPKEYLKFKVNGIKNQSENSSNCGSFSLRFLMRRFNGQPWQECSGWSAVRKNEKQIKKFKRKFNLV